MKMHIVIFFSWLLLLSCLYASLELEDYLAIFSFLFLALVCVLLVPFSGNGLQHLEIKILQCMG